MKNKNHIISVLKTIKQHRAHIYVIIYKLSGVDVLLIKE